MKNMRQIFMMLSLVLPVTLLASGAAWAGELAAMQRTHDGHYSCQCGPLKDFGCEQLYHRHLHMLRLPVRCRDKECDLLPPEGWCRHFPPT
jgi:hypothetical protein